MKAEQIFSIVNLIALAGWLLLAIAPRWKWTGTIVTGGSLSLLLSVAYLILIAVFFGSAEGGFGSLPDVKKLFTNDWIVLAGWIHYLAFDLFVGSWEVRDSAERGVTHWVVIPCLFFTFMFGPVGFLLYHIARTFLSKGGEK